MDWVDKLSIGAIAGITLITIGMLTNQAILKKQQGMYGKLTLRVLNTIFLKIVIR